jgi:hypothetical protein
LDKIKELFKTFKHKHDQIVLKTKNILIKPSLDNIKEEGPEHNIESTPDQIIA